MKGKVYAKEPIKVQLEKGKVYAWCSCGQSENQPFCNGAHKGSEFTPLVFKATESKVAWLCQCKHTSNECYCDGSHKEL